MVETKTGSDVKFTIKISYFLTLFWLMYSIFRWLTVAPVGTLDDTIVRSPGTILLCKSPIHNSVVYFFECWWTVTFVKARCFHFAWCQYVHSFVTCMFWTLWTHYCTRQTWTWVSKPKKFHGIKYFPGIFYPELSIYICIPWQYHVSKKNRLSPTKHFSSGETKRWWSIFHGYGLRRANWHMRSDGQWKVHPISGLLSFLVSLGEVVNLDLNQTSKQIRPILGCSLRQMIEHHLKMGRNGWKS